MENEISDYNHPHLKLFCLQFLKKWNCSVVPEGCYDLTNLEIIEITSGTTNYQFRCQFRADDEKMKNGAQMNFLNKDYFDWVVENREHLISQILE